MPHDPIVKMATKEAVAATVPPLIAIEKSSTIVKYNVEKVQGQN